MWHKETQKMKHIKAIFGLILISTSSFGQLNEQLWDHYLTEKQLTLNKVKLIIVERGDIVNHYIRPDGKIQRTVLANSDKSFFGEDKYYYYGNTITEVLGYRKENLYINKNYKYNDGYLEMIEVFQNKYLSKKYIYGTYTNGWINFITEHKVNGYQEQQLWTKNIKYYENGFIKVIDYRRGWSYHNSFYVYNKKNLFIEKEKIRIFEDNKETDYREILITTYDNGLTKSITIDGYTQELSYQFYSQDEFATVSDTLKLVEDEINKFETLRTDLVQKLTPQYQYIPRDINSTYSNYKRLVKEAFENKEKLKVLAEATVELNKFNSLEEKELKKLNREIKKKYGL